MSPSACPPSLRVGGTLASLSLCSLLSACALAPLTKIDDLGGGVHVATVRSGFFPRRSVDLKADAEKDALAFCQREGRALSVLDTRLDDPGPPAFSTAIVQFRCVAI